MFQVVPPNNAASSGAMTIASNTVRYTDPSSLTVPTGTASARSIAFFRYVPKLLGEIVISVDCSVSTGSSAGLRIFTAAAGFYTSSANPQGGGAPIFNSLTPLGTVTTLDSGLGTTNGQGVSVNSGSISTTPSTLTIVYTIFNLSPIFIGASTLSIQNVTMSNLRIAYDIVK